MNYRIFLSLKYFLIANFMLFIGIATTSIYAEAISPQQLDRTKEKSTNQKKAKEMLGNGRTLWKKGA